MHHVTALKPECAVGIAGWISAPEIISLRTDTAKRNGLCAKEHEVIAVLHASNHTISFEMVLHRRCQCIIVSFC
ncbi:hypothetical protein ACJIZ3_015079 [Penstemon smallii]|uniref:Uncharacterized protein n=1 Tax=Penstemon smallii TaxID=265156 RepID=A0ABD3RPV3_9LAMI